MTLPHPCGLPHTFGHEDARAERWGAGGVDKAGVSHRISGTVQAPQEWPYELEGMKLEMLVFTPKSITRGIGIVRGMRSIKQIGIEWGTWISPEEFWRKYDAGEFNK